MLGVIVFVILLIFVGALAFVSYAGAVRLRDDQVMYNTLQGVVRGLDKPYDDVAAARAAVDAVPSSTATVLLVDAATYEPWACNSEPERALTFQKPPGRALEGDGWDAFLKGVKASQVKLEGRVRWNGAYRVAYASPDNGTPYLIVAVAPP